MFEKGHKGYKKKGAKTHPAKRSKETLDVFPVNKNWVKGLSKKIVDIEEAKKIIYNDLDTSTLYSKFKQHGNAGKKYNK